MKKSVIATAALACLLAACSSKAHKTTKPTEQDHVTKSEVLFSSLHNNTLKLTLADNQCNGLKSNVATRTIQVPYNSNIVVGACVKVVTDKDDKVKSITNISRSESSSVMSRTGHY